MNKTFFLLLIGAMVTQCTQSQQSPRVTAEGKNVKVAYGQPSKRERVIFGDLVKYGEVWRTGANTVTEVTFAKDATVGGQKVKAGTYSLFTIPNEKEWNIILNSKTGFWGTQYNDNKATDVLNIKVPAKKIDKVVEKLTFRFNEQQNMILEWDQTQVVIPIKI